MTTEVKPQAFYFFQESIKLNFFGYINFFISTKIAPPEYEPNTDKILNNLIREDKCQPIYLPLMEEDLMVLPILLGNRDFTCCNTLCDSYVKSSSRCASSAAALGEDQKISHYKDLTT